MPPPSPSPPTTGPRMLGRGLTRRCARCGAGHLFHGWFRMAPDCPGCGLHFEREEGYWAGALAVNIIVTGAIFAVVFVTALALTIPDVPVLPVLAITVPIMVIVPIAYYPFSKTVWVAVDLGFLQRLQ